jgi:hypothetical protein
LQPDPENLIKSMFLLQKNDHKLEGCASEFAPLALRLHCLRGGKCVIRSKVPCLLIISLEDCHAAIMLPLANQSESFSRRSVFVQDCETVGESEGDEDGCVQVRLHEIVV